MKKKLHEFSIEDLKSILSEVEKIESIEKLKRKLNGIIREKEKHIEENQNKSLNERFDLELMRKCRVFFEYTEELIPILEENNILNMEDLINTPTEMIKGADSHYYRERIDYARIEFDMNVLEDEKEKPKQKVKGARK